MNLYEVLGVAKDATPKEIKTAFRALASKYHPDRNEDPGAPAMMQEVNRAYEVLSDAKKRERYDRTGQESAEPTIDEMAEEALNGMLMSAVSANDFAEKDYMQMVGAYLIEQLSDTRKNIKRAEKKVKKITKLCKVIKRKGDNLFVFALEALKAKTEEQIIAQQGAEMVFQRARELLETYEFTGEEPEEAIRPEGFFSSNEIHDFLRNGGRS